MSAVLKVAFDFPFPECPATCAQVQFWQNDFVDLFRIFQNDIIGWRPPMATTTIHCPRPWCIGSRHSRSAQRSSAGHGPAQVSSSNVKPFQLQIKYLQMFADIINTVYIYISNVLFTYLIHLNSTYYLFVCKYLQILRLFWSHVPSCSTLIRAPSLAALL